MRLRLWCQATRQETEAILTGLPNCNYCQHRLWSVINNYLDYTSEAPHKHRSSELRMSFSARPPSGGRPGLASDGLAALQADKFGTTSGDLLRLHLKVFFSSEFATNRKPRSRQVASENRCIGAALRRHEAARGDSAEDRPRT